MVTMIDPIIADQGELEFLGVNPRNEYQSGDATKCGTCCNNQAICLNESKKSAAVEKINNLDLSMVKMKLCLPIEKEGKGWMTQQADDVEVWYKRFLILCATRKEYVVPTRIIDEMWHAHILDTRKYHADCHDIFGHYLHHFPYFGLRGEQDAKDLAGAFEASRALFTEHFGESSTTL